MTTTAAPRAERKVLDGVVVSDKMDKTRVIQVQRRLSATLYGKVLTRAGKVYAHDEANDSRTGDRVRVMETRPLSKLKRWRIVKVLERAKVQAAEEAQEAGS